MRLILIFTCPVMCCCLQFSSVCGFSPSIFVLLEWWLVFSSEQEPASRFNYQIVCVLSQRWPRPLPVPSVCCFRFCFSLSAPAVRAVGFRSRLRSCSRHSGRPGCSSLVWSVRTLISPFQLLRAQGADYAHSARLFVVVRFLGRWIWLTQDQFFSFFLISAQRSICSDFSG
jgi:hypothetical protein